MEETKRWTLPREAEYVIRELNRNGFEAFVVGGCVRDGLLGREPGDWDVTTNALPEQTKAIFRKTVDTGIKHGTVTVLLEDGEIEVTTYRIDGLYEDGRHPSSVTFTASLEEDLRRRDFTMNAMAYHPEKGLFDPFGGAEDIRNRLIRTVGRAEDRFGEDALRMLRAIRFSAQLDFQIHEETREAIRNTCGCIRSISFERIRDELTKLLCSDFPMRFILLRDTNLLQYVLPEFEVCFHTVQQNPYHIYNVAVHSLKVVEGVGKNKCLRWAALLHDIAKPLMKTTDEKGIDHFYGHPARGADMAADILKRLRVDNDCIEQVRTLIQVHDLDIHATQRSVRKAVSRLGSGLFEELLQLKEADRRGQAPEFLEKGLAEIWEVREIFQEVMQSGAGLSRKDLAVNGHDLMGIGIRPGPEMKRILEQLLEQILDNPDRNTKEQLLEMAEQLQG